MAASGRQQGFSLIELMAVVLIVALVIGVAVMSLGRGNNSYQLRLEAKQFANQSALVLAQAVLARQQWGVEFYRRPKGSEEHIAYRWLRLDSAQGWLPAQPHEQAEHLLSLGAVLELEVEGQPQLLGAKRVETSSGRSSLKPQIVFYSSGEVSAFELRWLQQDEQNAVVGTVYGDMMGRIRWEPADGR
jgi:general secretion pathway protein H